MLDSILRTFVPILVGALLGWAAKVGLNLPWGAVTEIVTVAVSWAYYALARVVEKQWPSVGRWLISAGLSKKVPTYGDGVAAG